MPLLLTRTSYYNYYYTIVQKCISTKDQSLKKQKKPNKNWTKKAWLNAECLITKKKPQHFSSCPFFPPVKNSFQSPTPSSTNVVTHFFWDTILKMKKQPERFLLLSKEKRTKFLCSPPPLFTSDQNKLTESIFCGHYKQAHHKFYLKMRES